MLQYAIKILITAAVVVAVSEIARRNNFWAALLASIPLTSVLAFVWLYLDTASAAKVADLSVGIFWLVIPSLLLLILLPLLLRAGWNFWLSLLVSVTATSLAYLAMVWLLRRLGIEI
jgi:hypothetical protein